MSEAVLVKPALEVITQALTKIRQITGGRYENRF
jgi:hypothetical protein